MKDKTFGIPCFSPGFGGLEMNTLRLAQWMQERGWKVLLLLREGSAIHQKAIEAGLDVSTIKANARVLGQAKGISAWVKKNRLEVLLFPFRRDITAAAFYKYYFNRKIKIIYQQHMQVGVSKRDPIHTLRYAAIDAWISPLQYLKEETIAKTRVPAVKISLIPFGLDLAQFEQGIWNQEAARKALSLPLGPKIIGLLGRIDPKKGQDLVIKGIHLLREKYGAGYELLLLGDATLNEGDAYSMELKKLVLEYRLEDRIHFRPFRQDVLPFFKAIDIFAMPSHGETFGMVTLEAMAAGIPVVGTRKDGTQEILKDGALGYLFTKDDVNEFCRQVVLLEQNKSLPQMLQQAKDEVWNNYSKEAMCSKLEELLLNL